MNKKSQQKAGSHQSGSNMPKPMSETRGSYVPSPSAVKFSPPSPKTSTKVSKNQ